MKNARIKPPKSFEVTRQQAVERPNAYDLPLDMLSIVEWHPDLNAELPPEQVHLVLKLGGESETTNFTTLLWKISLRVGLLKEMRITHSS